MPANSQSKYWKAELPWLLLLKAPAIALRGRVLLLATLGLLAVWLVDTLLLPSFPAESQAEAAAASTLESAPPGGVKPVVHAYQAFTRPFAVIASGELSPANAVACLWRIAVWGFVGGAILRIAVLSYTRDESPDLVGAMRFAWRQASGTWGGPGLILVGLAAVWLPLFVVRLLMQVTWLAPIGAALWPVLIIAATLTTIFTIGAVIGWPLASAATAADGSDAFDAVSRMFAYLFQKPLRLAGYVAMAAVLAVASSAAAAAFLAAVNYACVFAAGGLAAENAVGWSVATVAWWNASLASLTVVVVTAQFWTSVAGVYLLRRREIDGVHLDEVYLDDTPVAGLRELKSGEAGVPEMPDDVNTDESDAGEGNQEAA